MPPIDPTKRFKGYECVVDDRIADGTIIEVDKDSNILEIHENVKDGLCRLVKGAYFIKDKEKFEETYQEFRQRIMDQLWRFGQ